MAAYRRVYDSRHLQADCQESASAPEPYARQSSMGYVYPFLDFLTALLRGVVLQLMAGYSYMAAPVPYAYPAAAAAAAPAYAAPSIKYVSPYAAAAAATSSRSPAVFADRHAVSVSLIMYLPAVGHTRHCIFGARFTKYLRQRFIIRLS